MTATIDIPVPTPATAGYTEDQAQAKLAHLAGTLSDEKYEQVMATGKWPEKPKVIKTREELEKHMAAHAHDAPEKGPSPRTSASPARRPDGTLVLLLAAVLAACLLGRVEVAIGIAIGGLCGAWSPRSAASSPSRRARSRRRQRTSSTPRQQSISPPPVAGLNF